MKVKILQIFLFISFLISFLFFSFRFLGSKNPLRAADYKPPGYNGKEFFDPSFAHLNTFEKLTEYCDSLFTAKYGSARAGEYELRYTNLVSDVIRKRFYWGYSMYSMNDNYLALLASRLTYWGYASPVMADDILKYPYAACSQQSIVMMELLQNKGITTRKIGFWKNNIGGHFALEAYYNGSWHFYDPTLEPDTAMLNKHNRPGIKSLVADTALLVASYAPSGKNEDYLLNVLVNYSYGKPNVYPAPNALLFHKVTKLLSGTAWIFFLLGFIIIRWYRKKPASLKLRVKSYKKERVFNYPASYERTA
ncbi:MAG: hypothetical protein HOP10_02635 [Chitinophagaceae bacterium]|nr:hypothetical protein [Chitinophagaceae bacterium]